MVDFTGRSVLITGCSGFIGSHLARKVRELGGFVHAIQHITSVKEECADKIWFGDLRDNSFVQDLVFGSEPDYVFHLASQAIVGYGENDSRYTLDTNVMGSINLFNALAAYQGVYGLHGVIVASTDKVYGRHKTLPYTEQSALLGVQQVYETSKHCEDILAQMARHSWELPIGITRFGNVYGPGDTHMSRIVPETISAHIQQEQPVIRSDGQHYRDFIYIDDVVDAYIKLADYIKDANSDSEYIFNFGTGIPVRILDLVVMISQHFTHPQTPLVLDEAEDEIHKQYVDATLAKLMLGWEAKTKLRDGITKTVDWYVENYNVQ